MTGYDVIHGGDDRYIGNIFAAGDIAAAYVPGADGEVPAAYGTGGYDGYPTTLDEYLSRAANQPPGDQQRFHDLKQPAYLRDNVYAPGARAFADEASAVALTQEASFEVADEGAEVYLETRLPEAFGRLRLGVVTSADLPRVRVADADFEERDGSPVDVGVDLLGERKEPGRDYPAGPIASLSAGKSRMRVW
jgi:hypothetical protein